MPRCWQAGGDDPQLRRHAPRALRARWLAAPRSSKRRSLDEWPKCTGRPTWRPARRPRHADGSRGAELEAGPDRLLLSGKMLTGRDAARKRIVRTCCAKGEAAAGGLRGPTASSTTSGRSTRCATKCVGPRRPDHGDADGQVLRETTLAKTVACSRSVGKAERGTGREPRRSGKHKAGLIPTAVGGRGLPSAWRDQGHRASWAFGDLRDGGDLLSFERGGHAGGGRRRGRFDRATRTRLRHWCGRRRSRMKGLLPAQRPNRIPPRPAVDCPAGACQCLRPRSGRPRFPILLPISRRAARAREGRAALGAGAVADLVLQLHMILKI